MTATPEGTDSPTAGGVGERGDETAAHRVRLAVEAMQRCSHAWEPWCLLWEQCQFCGRKRTTPPEVSP